MKVIFKNQVGKNRIIGEVSNREEAIKIIEDFCNEREAKVTTIRDYRAPSGTKINVDCRSEFFLAND